MGRFLRLTFLLVLTSGVLLAQERTITGTVTTPEDPEGLPGVNVLLKGTTIGTITDITGAFSIKVPQAGGVLVFSYVGHLPQEQEIGESDIINVLLQPDATQLKEIVVTGYGDPQDKRKFTGSVALVDAKLIENVPVSTFDQMLQGRAAGVMVSAISGQPGTPAFVRIRGISSASSVAPLYVMDGIPISAGDFAALNPNDIESVNILKDATSSSIYGSRGANGVVVITTKRGKIGTTMNYNFQYGITQRTNTQFNMMNTAQKIVFERMMAKFGLYQGEAGAILGDEDLSNAEKEQEISRLARISTDWTDVFFRTGITQMHELNASGGSDRTHFFISGSYRSEDGIIKESSLDRYTLRFNFDHDATNKLSFGVNNSIGYTTTSFLPTETGNNINNPVLYAFIANPYTRVTDPNTGEFEDGPTGFNLVEQMVQSYNLQDQIKIVSGAYLRYEFLPGLSARTNWGVDYSQSVDDFRINAGAPNQSGINGEQGTLYRGYSQYASFIGTTSLQYNRTLSDVHSFKVMLAQELIRVNSNGFNFSGYGLNDKLGSASAITQGTESNNFIAEVDGFNTDNALLSYFVDGQYSYKDRFTGSFSVRRDGSSRFGRNKRYGLFYSVGASWNVMAEAFMQGRSKISDLKMRISYGTQGRQTGIGDFQSLALYVTGVNYGGQPGIAPAQPENPDLQWEAKNSFDVGVDFSVFSGRISGTVDYYNNLTTKMFVQLPLSRTSGFSSLRINGGEMRNTGLEVSLNTTNFQRGDFEWTTTLNLTLNKNRVVDVAFEDDAARDAGLIKGKPYGTYNIVEWAGVNPANGDPLYIDKNGNVTNFYNDADKVSNFGAWDPPRFGGFTNGFRYRGFELSVFVSFQHGNKMLNNQRFFNTNPLNFGQFNQSTEMLNAWQKPGDITNVPRVTAQREFTSQDLEDASFARVKNVSLTYFVPRKIVDRAKLQSLKLYFQGQNLYTLTKYSGFDPEDSGGVQLSQYPVPRVFIVGLNIGF